MGTSLNIALARIRVDLKCKRVKVMFNAGILRAGACSMAMALCPCALAAQQATASESAAEELGRPVATDLAKRPAEMAANAPHVSCQAGQLTIAADNSTMRSVLAAVQACTGVQIEVPNAIANERSYIQLGPGSTREVMDTLLSSTELDYVIQPSSTSPQKIAKILLFARAEEDARVDASSHVEGREMSAARRAWMAGRGAGRPTAAKASDNEDTGPAAGEQVAQSLTDEHPKDIDTDAAVAPSEEVVKKQPAAGDMNSVKSGPSATSGQLAAAGDASAASATTDSARDATGAKELQNKIGEMQQLFEERKKLAANPGASQSQN